MLALAQASARTQGAEGATSAPGRGHSVREVIAAVEKVTGRKVPAREVGRRAGDPPALVADARKAADALAGDPKYAALETIVEHALRWHEPRVRG